MDRVAVAQIRREGRTQGMIGPDGFDYVCASEGVHFGGLEIAVDHRERTGHKIVVGHVEWEELQ